MPYMNSDNLTSSSSILVPFNIFSCLVVLARICNNMSNRSRRKGGSCQFQVPESFSFPLYLIVLAAVYHKLPLVYWSILLFKPIYSERFFFSHKKGLSFMKCLFCIYCILFCYCGVSYLLICINPQEICVRNYLCIPSRNLTWLYLSTSLKINSKGMKW